jgi:hypothetical protein
MIRKRIVSLLLALAFVMNMFGIFGAVLSTLPQNASASSLTFTPFNTLSDGGHEVMGFTYPPDGSTYNFTHAAVFALGQHYSPVYGNDSMRGFVKFNTSAIPDNAIVTSATLSVRIRSDSSTIDFDMQVWMSTNWATYIPTTQFWNITNYQGTMFNTAGISVGSRYSMAVDTDNVNVVGNTTYAFKSSRDGTNPPSLGIAENIYLYDVSQGDNCILTITYGFPGASVQYELDSGVWLNSTAFPEISDWNLTHDLYYFAFDTVPNTKNVTIWKANSTWTYRGVVPLSNYTENASALRLEDVYDSITYRVWFLVPKAVATTLLHISLYNAFTGEGFYWEQWKVQICPGSTWDNVSALTVPWPDYVVTSNQNYTIAVLDYFNNEIVNTTVITSSADLFVSIPVPVYSYKFYSQNPSFALLRIYYNLTGIPYSEFIPPYDYVARYLKAGTYKFMITFYDKDGIVGNSYQWIRTIPDSAFPGAGFVILEGDTISEAIIAANGAKALVQVVADLVSPDMLWIGYTVPQIPGYLLTISDFVINQNLYMVNGNIFDSDSGTNMTFLSPIPDNMLSPTISRDYFSFLGNLSTQIYINLTETGANVYVSATLPASVSLLGEGYSIWTNQSVSASRDSAWRWYRAFSWQYLAQSEKYIAEISVQNTIGLNWGNVTLFFPFMNASIVDNRSVKIYDMNNTVDLIEGTHFVQSKTGVYLWFNQWNDTVTRGFRLSYTATNESRLDDIARVTVNQIGDGAKSTTTWNNDNFYFAIAIWTNSFREKYEGQFYIELALPIKVDSSSIIVLTGSGLVVTDTLVTGNTIVIPKISVNVGDSVSYTILFHTKKVSSIGDLQVANIPVVLVALFIAIVGILFGAYLMAVKKENKRLHIAGKFAFGAGFLSLMLIFLVYVYMIATAGVG